MRPIGSELVHRMSCRVNPELAAPMPKCFAFIDRSGTQGERDRALKNTTHEIMDLVRLQMQAESTATRTTR